jgi:hypothetical protein
MERIYLTNADRVERFENNLVNVHLADGRVLEALEPRRLFPVSLLDRYITLLDSEGVEICVIRALADMQEESRKVLQDALDDYYLVPHITRIITSVEKYGTLRWTVETDRGIQSFDIRNRNHDIRVNRDYSIRVRDADDNRYIIEDYRTLDKQSRRALLADL